MNRARDPWPPWPPPDKKQRPERGGHRAGPQPVARTGKKNNNTLGRGNGQVERPFEIWTRKFDGSSRFYMAYADHATAELVANRLREIGLPCETRIARKRAATR